MRRSDSKLANDARLSRSIDWRGWLALAWAIWFGLLYAQMVIDRRGGTLRAWLCREPRAEAPGRRVVSRSPTD